MVSVTATVAGSGWFLPLRMVMRAVPGGVVNDLIALGHGGVLEKTLQLKKRDSAQRPEEPSPKKFAVSDEFGDCSAKLTLWLLRRMGKSI